jgi:hypothetical protein
MEEIGRGRSATIMVLIEKVTWGAAVMARGN